MTQTGSFVVDISNFGHLKFGFVSNFVLRYSNFHPLDTPDDQRTLVSSPPHMGHDQPLEGEGKQSTALSLFSYVGNGWEMLKLKFEAENDTLVTNEVFVSRGWGV
jgi:hypothetical protein